ncbi:MAG: hypothetical protein V4616_08520 [Bacteroidota bacterium]
MLLSGSKTGIFRTKPTRIDLPRNFKIIIMFTGSEGQIIPLSAAAALTSRFRTILMPLLGGIKGEFFGQDTINQVLAQPEAVGIRVYLGLSNDLIPLPKLVLVGVTAAGVDLINGVILEHGVACPPVCSIANPLNS